MKKIFLHLFYLLLSIAVHGQDILDFRMCDVYKGKVKSIVITSPEMMRSEIEFFIDGRIKSMKNQVYEVIYEWKGDKELKLIVSTSGENKIFYIYINEYKNKFYDYDVGEGNVKIWFRDNGSIDRKEATQNGMQMTSTYYYRDSLDLYPYKIENIMGAQTQTVFINNESFDTHGNVIVFTQSCNGATVRQERTITYY